MKLRLIPFKALLLFILLLLPGICGSQLFAQGNKEEQKRAADTMVIVPIPATQISAEYVLSSELIAESGKLQLTVEDSVEIRATIDTVFAIVDQFLRDSILQLLEGANIRELDNARNKVDIQLNKIEDFQSDLFRRTKEIEDATLELGQTDLRWQLTKEQADERGIPEALQVRIDQILGQIDSVNLLLQADFNTLLIGEDALSLRNKQLQSIQDSIKARKISIGESLFIKDMPGFFADLSSSEDTAMIRNRLEVYKRTVQADVKMIRDKYFIQLWIIVILTVICLIYAFWFKKNYTKVIPPDQFQLSEIHLTLIETPLATTLFIVILLVRFLFSEFALSLQAIELFILMIPTIIILLRRNSKSASPWIELLMVFYFLTFFFEIMFYLDILQRIVLLLLSTGGTVIFFLMIVKKTVILKVERKFVYWILRTILAVFTLLCFVAIFANMVGAFRMAEYFTLAFMQITILALVIYVTIKVVDALVFMLLAGRPMQHLNLVKEGFEVLHRKITWWISFFLWIYFFLQALDLLNFKEIFLDWGSNRLTGGMQIGEVDITPASILIFIFVIWLSVFLSRIITSILEKDIFTRITISKGMPNTISMLLKIAFITGGFFLAAAAAGMQLNNLSIVIGAFSVGIGFGLQNIFNNMVSGLILAFERPIKVGDTIEVGTLTGVVKKISFRSSTIRSFDGAEVIVPNGNLISDSMINWTLSDITRRMDIRVGVAYGTDPELVLEILKGVAEAHEQVRKRPAPSAFFIGFGDSSLDFRLLAWTDIDHRLTTESELHVSIDAKLKEAGIEIPFPQRDLHIRSDETK